MASPRRRQSIGVAGRGTTLELVVVVDELASHPDIIADVTMTPEAATEV